MTVADTARAEAAPRLGLRARSLFSGGFCRGHNLLFVLKNH